MQINRDYGIGSFDFLIPGIREYFMRGNLADLLEQAGPANQTV